MNFHTWAIFNCSLQLPSQDKEYNVSLSWYDQPGQTPLLRNMKMFQPDPVVGKAETKSSGGKVPEEILKASLHRHLCMTSRGPFTIFIRVQVDLDHTFTLLL